MIKIEVESIEKDGNITFNVKCANQEILQQLTNNDIELTINSDSSSGVIMLQYVSTNENVINFNMITE